MPPLMDVVGAMYTVAGSPGFVSHAVLPAVAHLHGGHNRVWVGRVGLDAPPAYKKGGGSLLHGRVKH